MNELAALGSDDIVLVTGGTGFTGSVLVRRLCELGCTVRVVARASSNRSHLSDLPVEWINGDVYDASVVEPAVEGVSYIFHVAAAYREAKISDDIYRLVHIESTKILANAALKNPSFKRFLHVSTVGVLGHIDNPPANESTPYNPGDIYQETKTVAETWIIDFSNETGLPITIVRPAAIYGPGDRRLLKVFKMAKLPVIPVIGFSKGLYHLIHVEDLVAFMILSARHNNALGETYICGNPQAISIKGIIEVIANCLGNKARYIRVPAWPFFMLGWLCEVICKPLNIEPPIYRRRVAFFTKDRSFDTTKMREQTGYQYLYSDEEGLVATAKWYLENKWM